MRRLSKLLSPMPGLMFVIVAAIRALASCLMLNSYESIVSLFGTGSCVNLMATVLVSTSLLTEALRCLFAMKIESDFSICVLH